MHVFNLFVIRYLSSCNYSLSCIYSFVKKPHKGIKFLQERGLLGKEPEDIAKFFFEDDRLDRVC